MLKQVNALKCTHVIAQVGLGYYDEDGNLIGEEMFPQSGENVIAAKLFHPHTEELVHLIEMCVQQAWEKLAAQGHAARPIHGHDDTPEVGNERRAYSDNVQQPS
jgi:hypothetical protein